ncbi:MAG: YiiX/YebB-like N1pC/P60 family cysteine hydrolase [Verrucomicrobiota bacterium]
MKVVFFHAKHPLARVARWFTRGKINHVGILDPDKNWFYESVPLRGVSVSPAARRLAGTPHTVYALTEPLTERQKEELIVFLQDQLGKSYDYSGVLRFVSRRAMPESTAEDFWFCSELVIEAFAKVGKILLRAPGWKITPEALSYSPALKRDEGGAFDGLR